ncbi:MAG: site-specific integrase [Chthoniobacteraceae bacterium]
MSSRSVSSFKKRRKCTRWVIAKCGSVEVPAYRLGDGRVCINYYEGGRRCRRSFCNEREAKEEAGLIAARLAAGDHRALQLSAADRDAFVLAQSHLRPLGIPLHVAAEDYANVRQRLPSEVTLLQVVEFFVKRHSATTAAKSVSEVVEEFISAKAQDGVSARYWRVLKNELERLGKAFGMPIGDVTTAAIETWLRSMRVGTRSRNNIRAMVISLFNYAKKRAYLPRDRQTEAEFVPRALVRSGDIHIFTPEQIEKILRHADADNLPFIALSAFAGLRHAEVLRLDWEDIRWTQDCIIIGKEKSKTATRRLAPLLPNLSRWLEPYRGCQGRIIRFAREQRRVQRRAEALGIEWHQNVLRHSYISYRVAFTQNVAQVALEAGNSPQVIFSNYRELVMRQEAEQYFALAPQQTS